MLVQKESQFVLKSRIKKAIESKVFQENKKGWLDDNSLSSYVVKPTVFV